MQRWRGLEAVPSGWGRSVVTVGVFDGVHRGHQQLISRAVSRARERDLPSVVVTFDPHPAELVRPGSHPAALTSLSRRAELVAEAGADAFCVIPFTPELSRMQPAEFAHEVLVDRLHAAVVVVGSNFTFGHRAAGDLDTLRKLGERFGFEVDGLDLIIDSDHGGITFSSTYVRSCIDAGDVDAAAAALGRPHRIDGVVVHGDRRGRELGFPTANIATTPYAALPADGVYAGWFLIGDRRLPSAISVGTNPTFSGRVRTVEAYVLDVDEDFYGHEVSVEFAHRLRGQERFDGIEPLIAQMTDDVKNTRTLLYP
ncbi:MAG: riboflavin kinase [Amycolatopsis sp.]|uniref:bifunctional riboflavin kinase/FAD synthetase n=1 Tax=Amycolatopsis sp. TaxID=37632 RepID=UPI0026362417|nr:bifunctional riboflavin kinase/FAD synthetase [Amycolatopsis sp.]MCU1682515.1 riboflavin kinase [Amycolatopsis sp.]MDT7698645.1 riboflavin kinase / adenylyltransferase [Pseudonocardiales bacterium]HEV7470732.1 bifunctional riboflavin kinase/FAD synthetase [Pseudonocardia sp.]